MALGTWFLNNKKKVATNIDALTNRIEFAVGDSILSDEQDSNGDFFLTKDKSLLYNKSSGDYSVLLGGNWRFELIIDSYTGLCVKVQCFLDELSVTQTSLEIPQCSQKSVYVTSDEPLSPACGCHYYPFENMAFWDPKKHLLCIGNPYSSGQAVEFTNNTIAIIENGKLMCVYLSLSSISGDALF